MINLIISIVLAAASWALTTFIFSSIWAGLLPFLIVLPAALIFLNKRTSKKFEAIATASQASMAQLPQTKSERVRESILENTIDILRDGYKYKHWQFFLASQIDAQIGQIYYLQKKFKQAEPYLANAFVQVWNAVAMHACIMFREKNYERMKKDFERALKYNRKIPILWNLYAYCTLNATGRDDALAILNRAMNYIGTDKSTMDNIDFLKNNGKMRMRVWNEQWYQFHLEAPPMQVVSYDKRSAFRRKGKRM
ncbi:MAG: hypothetical protein WC966_10015 [Bradymonadales bacterium]|jgi:tetratricopeptide (TPR) repeat protein